MRPWISGASFQDDFAGLPQLLQLSHSVPPARTTPAAYSQGDLPGVGLALIDGIVRTQRSRSSPAGGHHTTTLAGGRPVLVLDMYEHACHMDYGAAVARYVDVFMAIRWDTAVKLHDRYSRHS
jgi:Fe-Mn family superoxide dismutase